MHKKATDKFNAGYGIFFPFAFLTVIFHIVSNGIFVHTDDTMIANGNSVGIFPKVVDYRLCTVKGFLAVRNPVLLITDVQEFSECIVVTVFFAASIKLEFFSLPIGF